VFSILADGDVMSEKTEKATPHRLKKSKEQGKVSKSIELNTSIYMLVLLTCGMALYPSIFIQIKSIIKTIINLNHHMIFSVDSMGQLQKLILSKIIFLWLPFSLIGILSIVFSTIVQTGFVWSLTPLIPDFKRLDLSKGFRRLFSLKVVFEACKNSIKLSFVFLMLSLSIRHELPAFLNFIYTQPSRLTPLLMSLLSKLMLQLLMMLFALAIIDKLYTRWKFAKDNRMSKQELKDEHRQREGDPKIKSKIKQLQQQQRQKTASLKHVKTADVVITNPTHLAVVLKYDRGLMPAPKVVCKVQGELVKHVKLLAVRHQIPIIENKTFARALFATVDLNQWISREHFPVAAMIFREIYHHKVIN
jgi:flagellar biosynthetic protein FlhB